eukprot:NODE_10387_length_206_cov_118.859873_g9227_i0.p1 GENE.NODE_10387_length_206_cov_118.859873_g9227_i0~~NODE_10387_length_206_cov_118.859873_g9227_i0.p1  ORF type:complete len:52 (+),score=26.99 NODE_10387_length_206_cov_118.859873_g9227_i0:32-157(+)
MGDGNCELLAKMRLQRHLENGQGVGFVICHCSAHFIDENCK